VQHSNVDMTWVVGFSGGLDSTVLLHRFASSINAQSQRDLRREGLVAVYVNHQLQSAADGWAKHCQSICAQLNVPFIEVKLTGKPASAESIEAWARNGRMKALSDEAKKHPNPTILLAHHAQDQVETFLYRALRGSGATGLASMQSTSSWHGIPVQRPLINESRIALANYAQAQALKWIEDPSNKDERLARNAIRAQVIPSLRKVMPDATARIMKSVQSLADDAAVLAEVGAADFQSCAMSAAAMGALSEARQANVLRAWVRILGLPLPSRAVVQEMQGQLLLLGRKYTHSGQVTYAGWLWTRYRDRLAVARLPSEASVDWSTPPSADELRWQVMAGPERLANLAPGFAARCRATELMTNASNNSNFVRPNFDPDLPVAGRRSGALSLPVPRAWLDGLHVLPLGGATAFRLAQNRPLRSLKAHCQSLGIASVVRPWLPVLMHKDIALMAAGIGVNWEAFSQAQAYSSEMSGQDAADQTLLELRWDDTNDCRRAFL
jgi:tRNA(Ile)-lysidine synthase